jgi:TetR/AcrR family transcriptional regulator, transcriptional repressor for nem operon
LHPKRSVCFVMDNTRDFIIDEAFKLFLNHSYEAVSISDISKAIGFTKGALYHHFKNKEELFMSVVDKYLFIPDVVADIEIISLSEYIQFCTSEAEKIIKKLFGFALVYTPINYMSLFADAFRHYPGYAELKGAFISHEIEKTRIVLENAMKSGEIRDDINPSLIATNFFSINMGLAGNLVRNNSLDDAISLLKEQTLEFYKLLKK